MMSLCITSSYIGSRMQKHWFKVTSSSSEDGGMLLLTTVREGSCILFVAIFSNFCSINRHQCHRSVP